MQRMEMTNEQYHANRTHVSKSWLDKIHRSPAHLRHYLDSDETKRTKALDFGSIAHSLILERDLSKYVITPNFNCGSNAGKEEYAEYLKSLDADEYYTMLENVIKPKREDYDACFSHILKAKGKFACSKSDLDKAIEIWNAVNAHEAASMLLSQGEPEVTYFYTDPTTGVDCKVRMDWLRTDLNWIVDLKTTLDASRNAFEKSIATYRYHVQPAHYMPAVNAEKFFFIAVEKEPPYGVAVYDATCPLEDDTQHGVNNLIEHGTLQRNSDLMRYKHCVETGEWPGYSQEIQPIELKQWAKFT